MSDTTRKTVTLKQTSGGGFVFEDKISAWFLASLLEDNFAFDHSLGKICEISFQLKADGWLFDDLLLKLTSPGASPINVAVSGKSNLQFNSNGVATELLGDIWNQYLNEVSIVFDRTRDYLCIINAPLDVNVSKDLNTLLNHARALDTQTLLNRIDDEQGGYSQSIKKIFESFRCPVELAQKHGIDRSAIGTVLSRLILLEFDFEANVSKSENQLISVCRSCLKDPDENKEVALYERLCSIRGIKAPNGGSVDYETLVALLRNQFQLKGFANHSGDWERIQNITSANLNRIPDKIGGTISFSLDTQLAALSESIDKNRVVFLTGKSGYGKSVLGKKFIESRIISSKVIWVDPQSIENGTIYDHFGVGNSWKELIHKVQDSQCYLLIDGIDRFFKKSLNEISEVLSTAIASPAWKIILTCQTDDYNDVIQKLYQINIFTEGKVHEIKPIGDTEFYAVREAFPKLNELFKHDHLKAILKNLKFLDLLAFHIAQNRTIGLKQRIGESDIIDWIWKETVEVGDSNSEQNARFLQALAEKQANDLTFSVPKTFFSISDLAPLPTLKKNKVLEENKDKLFFVHDLYGDWARYKMIRANDSDAKGFILSKDLFSPLWCKAIRLYAISLLETTSSADWIAFFKSLNSNEPKEKIVQDLFLEAIIFSSPTYNHLESLWPFFKENKGSVLSRFFERFLMKATTPNPEILKWAKSVGGYTESEASIYGRNLNYSYWPGVLQFINQHKEAIIELASKKVSIITGLWLEKTSISIPFRKEAAEVAFANAEAIFNLTNKRAMLFDDVEFEAYKTVLRGVDQMPEKIIDLSLKLCRRTKFELTREENEDQKEFANIDPMPFPKSFRQEIENPVQWPDGPYDHPDDDFEKACLETDALNVMIQLFPEKAKEIILATLIDPPLRYDTYMEDLFHYKLDIVEPHGWFPPFFTRGPFLNFLRIKPGHGIDLVIRLINFATERWTNIPGNAFERTRPIRVYFPNQVKEYIGDSHVYFWFRDIGDAPHSVVSALMALEKFLIDKVRNDEGVAEYVNVILQNSNSVALLGILNSVGKYRPQLFVELLHPLLGTYEFHKWESMLDHGGRPVEGHQMIGADAFGPSTWKLAKEWHNLAQRKHSIIQTSVNLALNSAILFPFFKEVIFRWKTELSLLEASGGNDYLKDNLLAQLDRDNYTTSNEKPGSWIYNEPVELANKLSAVREGSIIESGKRIKPFNFKQALENRVALTLLQVEDLWQDIDHTVANAESINEIGDTIEIQSKFGCYAILIINRPVWKIAHPEFLDYILNDTETALQNLEFSTREFSIADIGFSWMSFVANYLPSLWCENTSDIRLRKLLFLVLTKSSFDINMMLFANISKQKKYFDKDFVQVQNLLLQWSVGVYRSHGYIDDIDPSKPLSTRETFTHKILIMLGIQKVKQVQKNSQFPLQNYALILLQQFLKGNTPTELLAISDIRLQIKDTFMNSRFNSGFNATKRMAGFSKDMVYHAFSSLPFLKDAESEAEYEYILSFWRQMLDQFVYEFGEVSTDLRLENGYPKNGDLEAIKSIARLIVDIKSPNERSNFWIPIFQYGGFAVHYIERFAYYFIIFNLEREDKYTEFFQEWDKMIDYARSTASWKHDGGFKNSWDVQDLTFATLGLSAGQIEYWNNELLTNFYVKAAPRIITWMKDHIYNQEVIEKLILLLHKKNGSELLKEGLPLIEKHLKKNVELYSVDSPEGFSHREFEHIESLAKTCSYIWEENRVILKRDSNLYKSYKEIVLYLVSTQNSIGLELQNRIMQN